MNMNKVALSLWGRRSNVLRHHFKLKKKLFCKIILIEILIYRLTFSYPS